MRMPMSWEVSKSLETARIAMPSFVWVMSHTRHAERNTVRNGVMMVTRVVCMPNTFMESEIQGIGG